MKKQLLFLFFFLTFATFSFGQIGGTAIWEFLNFPTSARVASLGGANISLQDDLNMAFYNPALLNSDMNNHFAINYVAYFADISISSFAFAHHWDKWGTFDVNLINMNYGKFIAADEQGNITGDFRATEYSVELGWSKKIDSSFSVGLNIKQISSVLETYHSYGIAADLGLNYYSPVYLLSTSLVIKNTGYQIETYEGNNHEPLPFEIQLGITKKLAHAPFRVSITATHLEKFDMTYTITDPNATSQILGSAPQQSQWLTFADKAMRHLVFGVELVPIKNFFFNMGYNYQRQKEMSIDTKGGFVGFSWGFGLKLYKFNVSYGRASYSLAGASNHFSISTNLSDFYSKATQNN